MTGIKHYVKENFPALRALVRCWKHRRFRDGTMEEKFTRIYRTNAWKDHESVSGTGSNSEQTRVIVRELPALLARIEARSLLDVACGDFQWMQHVAPTLDRYVGGDIVQELVDENNRKFGAAGREFRKLDLTGDELPDVDVVLVRDCLVHFSFADIWQTLANLKRSSIRYLLMTTFPDHSMNEDILTGAWRHLNFQAPPFSFPDPLELLREKCTEEGCADKSLGLWRIADLPARGAT